MRTFEVDVSHTEINYAVLFLKGTRNYFLLASIGDWLVHIDLTKCEDTFRGALG